MVWFQNEWVRALLIVGGGIVFAQIINYLMGVYSRTVAKRTKTDLDDVLVRILCKPLYVFVIIASVYLAFTTLPVMRSYLVIVDRSFFVVTVLLSAWLLARICAVLVDRWLETNHKFAKTPALVNKVIAVIIYVLAGLMVLKYFSIDITPLIAALGVGGLAVGLALQGTLANMFAGLHIISDRPIRVGDFVELPENNISGYVEDIGWRSTRIRTLPNTIVVVPNNKLAESVIINDVLPEPEMSCVVKVGVDYGSDLKRVEKVTLDIAKKIQKTAEGAVRNYEPLVLFNEFGENNVNFSVVLRVKNPVNKYRVIHEFIKALKERYDKEGIEISWPVRKIYKAK